MPVRSVNKSVNILAVFLCGNKTVGSRERMLSMATVTPNMKDVKFSSYRFRACVGRDKNNKQRSKI